MVPPSIGVHLARAMTVGSSAEVALRSARPQCGLSEAPDSGRTRRHTSTRHDLWMAAGHVQDTSDDFRTMLAALRTAVEAPGADRPGRLRGRLDAALGPEDSARLRRLVHQVVAAAEENVPHDLRRIAPLTPQSLHRLSQDLADARGWTPGHGSPHYSAVGVGARVRRPRGVVLAPRVDSAAGAGPPGHPAARPHPHQWHHTARHRRPGRRSRRRSPPTQRPVGRTRRRRGPWLLGDEPAALCGGGGHPDRAALPAHPRHRGHGRPAALLGVLGARVLVSRLGRGAVVASALRHRVHAVRRIAAQAAAREGVRGAVVPGRGRAGHGVGAPVRRAPGAGRAAQPRLRRRRRPPGRGRRDDPSALELRHDAARSRSTCRAPGRGCGPGRTSCSVAVGAGRRARRFR